MSGKHLTRRRVSRFLNFLTQRTASFSVQIEEELMVPKWLLVGKTCKRCILVRARWAQVWLPFFTLTGKPSWSCSFRKPRREDLTFGP